MKLLPSLSALLLMTLTAAAHADSMYSTAASFAAATNDMTDVTFNGLAPWGLAFESNGFTTGGASFSASGLSVMTVVDSQLVGLPAAAGDVLTFSYLGPTSLTIDLPASTSVAFDFGNLVCLDSPLTITLSDGYSTTIPNGQAVTTGSLDFVGFTSGSAITSVTLTMGDGLGSEVLDDVEYGKTVSAAASTPEPGSLLLAATGMVGAAGALYSASKRQMLVEERKSEEQMLG